MVSNRSSASVGWQRQLGATGEVRIETRAVNLTRPLAIGFALMVVVMAARWLTHAMSLGAFLTVTIVLGLFVIGLSC